MPENKANEKNEVKEQPVENKVQSTQSTFVPTLSSIIASNIGYVMIDRKHMPTLEREVDNWIKQHYQRTPTSKKEYYDQLTNAKLCAESIFNRVIQQL